MLFFVACALCHRVKVALYAAEKLLELGAIPVTFGDSSGHVYEPEVRQHERLVSRPFSDIFFCRI